MPRHPVHCKQAPSFALLAILAAGLLLSSCPAGKSRQAAPPQDKPDFVVSVAPLELLLRELAGERATVRTLLKAGSGAHTYDPSPADAQAVAGATAFFWIGPGYDPWAADFQAAQTLQVLSLVPPELLIRQEEQHDHHGHAHGEHEAGAVDPHFYSDPLLIKQLLPELARQLGRFDPAGAATYEANADRFGQELELLDAELRASLAPVAGQPVLMFHPSFNYFLQRYGLVYQGSIEPFPGKEPSPKYLQDLVRQVRAAGVRAIFSETLLPEAPAQAIAEAAGVPLIQLDPACGNSGRAYQDYAGWLRYNAGLFLEGLGER